MTRARSLVLVLMAALVAAYVARPALVAARAGAAAQAPVFEVDPFWPKPLPNHWVLGSTIGLSVDAQDHVWILHRPQTVEDNFKAAEANPPIGVCCKVAPPVLEFDQEGNLLTAWGGPGAGYEWPESNHGITVDSKGNVWIGGNGNSDTQILKFTRDGKFLLQIGKHGVHNGSNDTKNFWRPAKIWEDAAAGEMYVADGYGNRRVIVVDRETGAYKRHWGAYGTKQPDDAPMPAYKPGQAPSKQFNTVHCADVSRDGLVYVCDRVNDRVQVFRKDGTFVKEAFFDTNTLRSGSVWDMTFSSDPQQTYIYMANGVDEKISVVLRSTLQVLTSFGDGGRQPGQFFGVHNLAADSHGNLYATETYTGARVQKFRSKGLAPVSKTVQGVPWPKGTN
jgi:DNA-binding beta-propeller fold protein YncE